MFFFDDDDDEIDDETLISSMGFLMKREGEKEESSEREITPQYSICKRRFCNCTVKNLRNYLHFHFVV